MSFIKGDYAVSESQEFKDKLSTCPICFDVFDKPLVCGTCGNSFCEQCVVNMKYVCPLCGKVTEYSRNVTLENILVNLPIRCKCNRYFPKNEMEKHSITCPAHERKCKFCGFVGNSEQRTIHGIDEHPEIIRERYFVLKS